MTTDTSELQRGLGRLEGQLAAIQVALDRAHTARAEQAARIAAIDQRMDKLESEWSGSRREARGFTTGVALIGTTLGSVGTFVIIQWDKIVGLFK